jgi:charged multivesicular body protein 4
MPGFKKYFRGKRDTGKSISDAIATLRQQLHTMEKKEAYLQKKIDEELKKAKANVLVSEAGASCRL